MTKNEIELITKFEYCRLIAEKHQLVLTMPTTKSRCFTVRFPHTIEEMRAASIDLLLTYLNGIEHCHEYEAANAEKESALTHDGAKWS